MVDRLFAAPPASAPPAFPLQDSQGLTMLYVPNRSATAQGRQREWTVMKQQHAACLFKHGREADMPSLPPFTKGVDAVSTLTSPSGSPINNESDTS
eukprot:5689672-Amphidinium_carterae.1